mmetsp:Transcript_388/g.1065  ORF Transcript_388/g.1065 Transcript_388/m.1065 type:complete len:115 (-) Transcript_388:214-558(-)|eukprot:CAMPEP_0198132996 /NCGR_PEP_ID=MMETSP1442-20131203/59335_1 /TAXON_ID= /ORGANISM="Craspedostauros australis, Strain CCMP3328" /LENGTH=114 /DNA_ID=CAMNT_0043794099 /DNA_START=159 /DNA_END=503 /DNA_ORIENTATION=+
MKAVLIFLCLAVASCNAFVTPSAFQRPSSSLRLEEEDKDRLRSLGYSEDEIDRSRKMPEKQPEKVRVDLVDDVDSVSLTAIGFGLIAFNFFVLANMGDGGIAGVVATIINSSRN